MIDIFIKSYSKDFKLLNYCLQSIAKYLTGYNKIILLIPNSDLKLFNEMVIIPSGISIEIIFVDEKGNGYLRQQWYKLNAHTYSKADYILFGDSDCIFNFHQNLEDYISDGKPEILFTDYSKVETAIIWKEPTEIMMGEPVQFEFMRRNCLIYHRSTLENICKWQPNLEHIIMLSELFSEFNLMGAYAFKYEKVNYNFINTDDWTFVPAKAEQLWSHCNKYDGDIHKQEYARALEVINKALELNITEL